MKPELEHNADARFQVDPLVRACCTCAHWDRKWATDAEGAVRKGFLARCLAPVAIPADAPSALRMQAMNWDEGQQCPTWSAWDGVLKFVDWDDTGLI